MISAACRADLDTPGTACPGSAPCDRATACLASLPTPTAHGAPFRRRYEFGKQTLPERGAFRTLFDAMQLGSLCGDTVRRPTPLHCTHTAVTARSAAPQRRRRVTCGLASSALPPAPLVSHAQTQRAHQVRAL